MRVTGLQSLTDPVPHNAPALKVTSPKGLAMSRAPGVKTGRTPRLNQPSIFGNRAIKSPEDYETGEAVQGLGRQVSPYFAQQFAQKGRQLKYDTATNTFR
jgi:hypothetical protein